ncbi:hypothetical protein [Streptomyces sp. NBC_01174]|uniref:hypothetical protein n=1 Tax=Streptomyces sp. NBC_01174 TaxID=2903758 RepID=UPI00386975E4|nr:hypothetical protein OG414_40930 [Streptomyces sp. NBC_01174]
MSDTMDRTAVAAEAYRRQPDGMTPEAARAYWRDVTLGEEQADRLGWSSGQAAAVESAVAGTLVLDRDGAPRHVTGAGPGRRVAAGRIAALRRAGYLTDSEPDATGRRRIEATADGRRALAVWQRWTPTPVVMTKRTEAEVLAPLHQGAEARRRAVAAARSLRESERRREAEWAALEVRMAADRREDQLNKQWRQANGVINPFAKRPAGWTPEVQAEADRAAELEAAEAAARDAAHVCEAREPDADERPQPTQPTAAGTGRPGTLRREATETVAHGHGVRNRRTPPDPRTGRVLAVEGAPVPSRTGAPSSRRAPNRLPDAPRISRRAHPYGSINTRARRRRTAPTAPPSRPTTPALEKEGARA